MSDVSEGIGGLVEGALLGGAVEQEGGKAGGGKSGDGACLNCGAEPFGKFCHSCGQKVQVHRTLSAIGHDLLHGVLHLDGKFWNTLPMLLFKPGKLTRRYIDGERAKFVSPMAMFLFSVFAMFAVFQMVGISAPTDIPTGDEIEASATETAQTELSAMRQRLESQELSDKERTELADQIALLEAFLEQASQDEPSASASADGKDTPQIDIADGAVQADFGDADLQGIADQKTGVGWLDAAVTKWRTNPSLMLYKMQANAYKFSWLLIPISLPFVWLIFAWKRRFKAYDHAIFITYSLGFMSLLFIALSVLGVLGVPAEILILSGVFIPPIHLYKHLRGTYEIGRFSAIWRLLVLSSFIWIVVALFVQLLFLLGAF